MQALQDLLSGKRPAEAVALLGIAAPVYGFLQSHGVSEPLAAIIAVVAGVVPLGISTLRDRVPAGDHADPLPVHYPPEPINETGSRITQAARKVHEVHGIDHEALDAAV